MKKLILLLILPILLCSCNVGKVTQDELLAHQSADLSCVYYAGDFDAEIDIRHGDDGELLITYRHPESLSGLTFAVAEGEAAIMLSDIRYPLPAENEGHLLKIYDLLTLDRADYKKLETSNGGISYEGLFVSEELEATVSYDMREGRAALISTDGFELEICAVGIIEETKTTELVQ